MGKCNQIRLSNDVNKETMNGTKFPRTPNPEVRFEEWFPSTDHKLYDIGFVKVKGDNTSARYERYDAEYAYVHILYIINNVSRNGLIIRSYGIYTDTDSIFALGLSEYETRLALKKGKELKRKKRVKS